MDSERNPLTFRYRSTVERTFFVALTDELKRRCVMPLGVLAATPPPHRPLAALQLSPVPLSPLAISAPHLGAPAESYLLRRKTSPSALHPFEPPYFPNTDLDSQCAIRFRRSCKIGRAHV